MVFLDGHIFHFFITDCGMGSDLNFFLVILCPVHRLRNLQLRWNFLVGHRNIASFDRSATVLVGVASS